MTSGARELIDTLLGSTSTVLADVIEREGDEQLLTLSNQTGTMQLYELSDGKMVQLTALTEPVSEALYIPEPASAPAGAGHRVVLASDVGGNERDQLYLLNLGRGAPEPARALTQLTALTANPAYGHHIAGVSPDGRLVAYTSNRLNGIDYDLWTVSLLTGVHHLTWAGGGYLFAAGGFSPDGRYVAVYRASARWPLSGDLMLVDVSTGTVVEPFPHPDGPAAFGAPVWIDATRFFVRSDLGRDFAAIVKHDLATGQSRTLPDTGVDGDAIALLRAADAGTTVLLDNRDCATPLFRYAPESGRGPQIDWPEPGICTNWATPVPQLSRDGGRLYFSFMSLRHAAGVYRHDLANGVTTRLTEDDSAADPGTLAEAEIHTITSFDGEPIQLYVMRPAGGEAMPPVVVSLHGGPALQSQLRFDPVKQALVAAGYAVVVPNVRGSSGYGRRFASLDDVERRLDAVADLAAVHGALAGLGLDDRRAALWGESYGGYMTLAGVSMQPDLWAAGVDIVGIANVLTYLENTSPYRRALREVEYGSLATDRELLARISPMTYADQIRAPLLIIHGRNDPRVPVSESETLHATLAARGIESELVIYENEGHGVARLENRLDAYPRAIAFLDGVLKD